MDTHEGLVATSFENSSLVHILQKIMIPLAFFPKLYCLSLKNIILYLHLHKLATNLIWVLIGYSPIHSKVWSCSCNGSHHFCTIRSSNSIRGFNNSIHLIEGKQLYFCHHCMLTKMYLPQSFQTAHLCRQYMA